MALRQGEQLLVAIGIPLLVLVFFSTVDLLPTGNADPIGTLAPAVLSLAIMSSAMVSLGIGTGFERHYGVLKRLGATPLGRPRLLAAKMAAVGLTEMAQLVALTLVALGLGWHAGFEALPFILAVLAGTSAFAGIGMSLAGSLSGPANLAATNGLYLVLLLFGGIAVPPTELPGWARYVVEGLPSGALVAVMRSAAGQFPSASPGAWAALLLWAVVAPAVAAATFRWQPRS